MPDFAAFITKEQARIACAEILGWAGIYIDEDEGLCGLDPKTGKAFYLPRFDSSLDAMREAVLTLSAVNHPDKDGLDWSERCEYLKQLEAIVFKATGKAECQFELVNATAEQQCEAFLKVHGRNVKIEK